MLQLASTTVAIVLAEGWLSLIRWLFYGDDYPFSIFRFELCNFEENAFSGDDIGDKDDDALVPNEARSSVHKLLNDA
jgi:hypothetical protein